jgi:tetratricopeptide (TPR) repeat protein
MAAGEYTEALEHGWRGYDAVSDAERRATMINNLSSLAFRTGRCTAARRGFLAAYALTKVAHQQLPALGGLALVCAASKDRAELGRVASTVERVTSSTPLRYEVASVRLELAQAWQETGDLEKANECVARAHDLAVAHGFHEVSFRSELLAEALEATRTAAARSRPDSRFELAIARFDELTVDESALVTA